MKGASNQTKIDKNSTETKAIIEKQLICPPTTLMTKEERDTNLAISIKIEDHLNKTINKGNSRTSTSQIISVTVLIICRDLIVNNLIMIAKTRHKIEVKAISKTECPIGVTNSKTSRERTNKTTGRIVKITSLAITKDSL